jgi:hypothetical protein
MRPIRSPRRGMRRENDLSDCRTANFRDDSARQAKVFDSKVVSKHVALSHAYTHTPCDDTGYMLCRTRSDGRLLARQGCK